MVEADATSAPYCPGDRCEDCTSAEECCEATCGCCPRVDEHDMCWLHSGSEDDSKYCDQHGEGWLFDTTRAAELRWLQYEMDRAAARDNAVPAADL